MMFLLGVHLAILLTLSSAQTYPVRPPTYTAPSPIVTTTIPIDPTYPGNLSSYSTSLPVPTCTSFYYPAVLNTTAPQAFYLHVSSSNPLTSGRQLQLRTVNGTQIVVVDARSPVLWVKLVDGVIHSDGHTDENQPYDLGPMAFLRNVSSTATSSLQEFCFKNSTATDNGFQLFSFGAALYGLYHQEPLEVVNGFVICDKRDYSQVFYNTYIEEPPAYPDCEFVGIQVSAYCLRASASQSNH